MGIRYTLEKGYPSGQMVNPSGAQPKYTRGSTREVTERSDFYACMSAELDGSSPGDRGGAIENFRDAVSSCS